MIITGIIMMVGDGDGYASAIKSLKRVKLLVQNSILNLAFHGVDTKLQSQIAKTLEPIMSFLLDGAPRPSLLQNLEELSLTMIINSQILKFNSPFEGQLKVMVADKDLISMEAFDVSQGRVEMSFPLGDIAEPAHIYC